MEAETIDIDIDMTAWPTLLRSYKNFVSNHLKKKKNFVLPAVGTRTTLRN
jgi:hypothetical protein